MMLRRRRKEKPEHSVRAGTGWPARWLFHRAHRQGRPCCLVRDCRSRCSGRLCARADQHRPDRLPLSAGDLRPGDRHQPRGERALQGGSRAYRSRRWSGDPAHRCRGLLCRASECARGQRQPFRVVQGSRREIKGAAIKVTPDIWHSLRVNAEATGSLYRSMARCCSPRTTAPSRVPAILCFGRRRTA